MTKTIALIGALDTKGKDFAFVKEALEERGHEVLVIDTGVMGEPKFAPDVAAAEVAQAGGTELQALREQADRGKAIEVMTRGIAQVVQRLHDEGRIDGVLGMGGSAGTVIGTSAMRALPVGFPKVMVSTVAAGDTAPYVGSKDVVMIPSVVDVAGVNSISSRVYANAAGAIAGMVETPVPEIKEKPLLAASMFGNTTPLVERCKETLEEEGYEVLVFHATGTGGRTMESLIDQGFISGVLDVSPTEWADELVGGVLTAGPTRMEAAAKQGVPQVIVPGCLDMVNFWARDTVPEKFSDRLFYEWNPNVTLMRTTPEENAELGRILAEKANASDGPVAYFLPLKGVSMLDAPGKEFWWPEADEALFEAIKAHARADSIIHEFDNNVNDPEFADAVAEQLLAFLKEKQREV
jgi:uncharacterized protein (UPF0261 family)